MKSILRKEILEARKRIVDKDLRDYIICTWLKNLIEDYDKIMIYYPISNEPNLLDIMDNSNKSFYLPFSKDSNLEIRKIVNLNDLEEDEEHVPSSKIKSDDSMDVVIVPAIAMNKQFYRLGYGKGYYDRFLKNKNVLKIAVVYHEFLIDDQYQDEWDVQFDYIVTDLKVIKKEK